MICAHCESNTKKEGLSGMRHLKNGDILPYVLCVDCCSQLTKLSVGKADSSKIREKYWAKVEKNLKLQAKNHGINKEEIC